MQRKKVVPEKLKLELREIRKKVRLGIKKDRIQFFEDIAKEAEIASRVGDSKGVFSALMENNRDQRRSCGSEKCRC